MTVTCGHTPAVASDGPLRLCGPCALDAEESGNVSWDSSLDRTRAVAESGALMVLADYPPEDIKALRADGTLTGDSYGPATDQ